KVSVYPVVNFWIYRQKYLTNDQGTHHFLIGGTLKEDYTLDNLDIAIIKAISRNARATLQELSNTTKTSPSVIAYRISNLEKRKIILGYKARINLAAIGYTNFKAQLYFHSFSSNLENKFRIFCSKHPRIISYIQQIGECRNELEIHAQDYNEYQNVIDELRNSFPNLIDSVSSIMMRNESLNWAAFCS
ncbi:Lrp/AsnC family transcriptional regulator, partial [bacterium]|nr:Lrp/AsnC family transcriptional regulator [bacterium]